MTLWKSGICARWTNRCEPLGTRGALDGSGVEVERDSLSSLL